ncbi:3-oxoacyl-reductase [Pyrenochaeta sp. DS3sAY3a]|nr:3-oxoacyl-reductase [Pyrenochaeta sp. DS3sAY3a]
MSAARNQRPLRILITGGARGIGRGLLRHFLQAGHEVMVLDHNAEELDHVRSTQVQQWAHGRKEKWQLFKCDLSNREHIRAAVDLVREKYDETLDVLINNAFPTDLVISQDRKMEAEGEDIEAEWDKKIAIGLTAPFILSRLCVPLLAAGHSTPNSPGTIINMSSTRAYQAEADHEAYSTAKAGILGLTQSMSVSLGHRHKIRVNAIIPGWIHVANESKHGDEQGVEWQDGLTEEDAAWHPAGRVGNVEDIARTVEYLVGSEFVTGQELTVDGGVGRKMVYPE